MKKYICYSLLLLLAATAFQACKYDSLMVFDQKSDAFFSWLDGTNRTLDTTKIRFFYVAAPEVTVDIPVKITGPLSGTDRYVAFTTVEDKTTAVAGQHYEILSETITIPANKTEGILPVRIHRTPDLSDTNTGILRLSLRLEANEAFGTNYREKLDLTSGVSRQVLEYCIEMSDGIVKPKFWFPYTLPPGMHSPLFGEYSEKKFLQICAVNSCPPAYLDGYEYTNDSGVTMKITTNNYMAVGPTIAKRTQIYLNQQKALGNTIYEDDGITEMKMGSMGQP